jgi:hypothetical protein
MLNVKRDAWLLCAALVATFAALRLSLWIEPDADLTVFGYNVHHLYTGMVISTLSGLPLVLLGSDTPFRVPMLLLFGAGLSMSLDEWVYLLVTDGSNASYLTPVSFWGGLAAIGVACGLVLALAYGWTEKARRTRDPT